MSTMYISYQEVYQYTALTMNKKYPYPPRPQFSWLPRAGIMGATLSSSFAGENLLDWMKLD